MNFQKLKKILGSKDISEEQVKALNEFFSAYTEEVKKSVLTNEGEMIPKSVAAKAFKEFQGDAETAFNLFKEDSKKAFNLFKTDAENAFDIYAEDLQNEYSLNMIRGFQELYEDIQSRVQKDFLESKDVKVLNEMKKVMTPIIASDGQQALLEEIDKLKSERNHVINETKELTRENIINSLVKDFPTDYVEEVKGYLEASKDEDDIYERFSFICEMIDKGAINPKSKSINEDKKVKKTKTNIVLEDTKTPKKIQKKKRKKVITEEDLNTSGTVKSKTQEPKIKIKEKKYFSEEDDALINMLFTS